MNLNEIRSLIKDYPDFPKKGIVFKDISPVLADASAFGFVIDEMSKLVPSDIDSLIGIDARGFIFASAIAKSLNKGLIMARKGGKLPGDLVGIDFSYEYNTAELCIQKELLKPGSKLAIVDDVLATGSTVYALRNLTMKQNVEVSKILCFLELDFLKGRDKFDASYRENILSLLHL